MAIRSYLIGDPFYEGFPSQVVLAHSQPAQIIANVFVVGYSVVKLQ